MESTDDGDRPLRGVAMTEAERDEFLRERGIGVLSLGGFYALALTGVTLVLCVATLAGVSV